VRYRREHPAGGPDQTRAHASSFSRLFFDPGRAVESAAPSAMYPSRIEVLQQLKSEAPVVVVKVSSRVLAPDSTLYASTCRCRFVAALHFYRAATHERLTSNAIPLKA
jgi:hypothetical protein